MLLSLIKNIPIIKNAYVAFGNLWVERKLSTVVPFIKGNCIDIGAGNGSVALYLQKKGIEITALDVDDLSIHPSIPTIVYDGDKMPFPNQSFHTGLLLTVLHHTDSPESVLKETARVCKRIIIIEDVYSNIIQQYLTYAMDTLVNWGHSNMTYQNKNDLEWKKTFQEMGLHIIEEKKKKVLILFTQKTYVLEKI